MIRRWAAQIARVSRSNDGVVAIQMALTLSALLGMAGLATESASCSISSARCRRRRRRRLSGAIALPIAHQSALSAGKSTTVAQTTAEAAASTEAVAVAGQNGFVNKPNGVNVTVNTPPLSPAIDAGNNNAVQVI